MTKRPPTGYPAPQYLQSGRVSKTPENKAISHRKLELITDGSPSFVREPEGSGCAERFIRTLKENLPWVRSLATIAELVEALRGFKRTYNERWLIRRRGHRAPGQVRRDLLGGLEAAA